jgi:dihydroxyacetone kinase
MELAAGRVESGASVSEAMRQIGNTLIEDIGGAMGPLYGVFFLALADASEDREWLDASCVGTMLRDGTDAVIELGGAEVGDKTLIDVLVPAVKGFEADSAGGKGLAAALRSTAQIAAESRDATKDMIARVGRAARAGERSRGQIDAGAASCALIVGAICNVLAENVQPEVSTQ